MIPSFDPVTSHVVCYSNDKEVVEEAQMPFSWQGCSCSSDSFLCSFPWFVSWCCAGGVTGATVVSGRVVCALGESEGFVG